MAILGPQDTNVITHASVNSTLNTGQTHIVADTTINTPFVNNLQQALLGPGLRLRPVRDIPGRTNPLQGVGP